MSGTGAAAKPVAPDAGGVGYTGTAPAIDNLRPSIVDSSLIEPFDDHTPLNDMQGLCQTEVCGWLERSL